MQVKVTRNNANKPLPLILEMQAAISTLQKQVKELQNECARNSEMIYSLVAEHCPLETKLSNPTPKEIKAHLESLSKQEHLDNYAPEKLHAGKFCEATKQNLLDTCTTEEKSEGTGRCPEKIEYNVRTPLKQEKEKMGNWEAFTMDEAASTLCTLPNEHKVRQGSGFRSMELSPLMKTIPTNIEQAAAVAKEIPKLVPAVKDVLTAAERLYNIITDDDQRADIRTIDDFLIKYAEFEPWSVYCTAFALLMDRCWSKNEKNKEKED